MRKKLFFSAGLGVLMIAALVGFGMNSQLSGTVHAQTTQPSVSVTANQAQPDKETADGVVAPKASSSVTQNDVQEKDTANDADSKNEDSN